ncbi:MAG: response regulator [Bryobacteraceae bacterium]
MPDRAERLILEIAEAVSNASGQEFFSSLVRHLAFALEADDACLATVSSNRKHARIIARFGGEKVEGKSGYALEGTAFEHLLEHSLSIFPHGVQALFPDDSYLRLEHAESFCGISLRDSSGRTLGLLAVLRRSPLQDPDLARRLLEAFAPRASEELAQGWPEDDVEQSERLYRALFESAGDAISVMCGGVWVDCNRKALEIYGCERRDQLVGRKPGTFIPPAQPDGSDSKRLMADRFDRALAGETLTFEWRMQRLDGSPFDAEVTLNRVEISGECCLLARVSDVTARYRAAQALVASERRLHALLESAHLAAVMLDVNGIVTYCNDYLLRLTGWSLEDAEGQNWFETFIPDEDRARVAAEYQKALDAALSEHHCEAPILTRSGECHLLEWDNTVLRDPAGVVVGTASLGRDVTEHRALQERLRQSQKLESIGRLAGGIAHDFNNVLTVINGYSDLLLNKLDRRDPIYASVSEISKAGERAAALTQQLLTFGRRQMVQPALLDLNMLVRDLERMLRRLIGEDIDMTTRLDPNVGPVLADPGQMHQVLLNLALNARDAMPAGGKMRIATAHASVVEAVGEERTGSWVMLSVMDTGTGIDEKIRSHIFEPFFTTKEPGRGTGLGLSTVYGIVEQSGGWIRVISSPGAGSTFQVFLPPGNRTVAAVPPVLHTTGVRGKGTVLVVEDQDDVRRLTCNIVKELGYFVLEASSGREALGISQRFSGPIHLVLTDVVMPGMSGPDLGTALKAARPDTKVLYMSGYPDGAIAADSPDDGELELLAKPFTRNTLAARIRELMSAARRSGSILVVDGNAGVRNLLRELLTAGGYAVREAENGLAALLELQTQRVDIVITDLAMPEQEGVEIIRRLRGQKDVKIIAMSGAFGGDLLKTAKALGADAILRKPLDAGVLLEHVRELLEASNTQTGS